MNNEGKITVFLSLITMVMVSLIIAVLQIVDFGCAKTKGVTTLSCATSSVKADYNRYIYDRYHILLIDKTYNGAGEGQLEENIRASMQENLGEKFDVKSIELSGTTGILDNNCAEFKEQIKDYIGYGIIDYSVEKLIKKTGENDTPVSDSLLSSMDLNIENQTSELEENSSENGLADEKRPEQLLEQFDSEKEDPRKSLKIFKSLGIAMVIRPDDLELKDNEFAPVEMPSYGHTGISSLVSVATDFDDYSKLKKDLKSGNSWQDALISGAAGVGYAAEVFNCATDIKYDDTFFNCELEYLICGKTSDVENYKSAVDKLLTIRLGINFAYILTDAKKMAELTSLAFGLSFITLIPEPILKYLLAGCWSYIEGIADVYFLLRGHDIPYVKTGKNWITTMESLAALDKLKEPSDDEKGMSYKEYLLLLLAFNMDEAYYRMLDIIELNVRQEYKSFKMKNAITEFAINAELEYLGRTISIRKEESY